MAGFLGRLLVCMPDAVLQQLLCTSRSSKTTHVLQQLASMQGCTLLVSGPCSNACQIGSLLAHQVMLLLSCHHATIMKPHFKSCHQTCLSSHPPHSHPPTHTHHHQMAMRPSVRQQRRLPRRARTRSACTRCLQRPQVRQHNTLTWCFVVGYRGGRALPTGDTSSTRDT